MMVVPPVLDGRSADDILAGVVSRAKSYLGVDWGASGQASGAALLKILASFSALVVERLNRVPDKAYLTFLDTMGVTILAPQAARVPLVFHLASAPADVFLPADTEVAAVVPPALPSSLGSTSRPAPDDSSPLIFATDQAISLTRAQLASVYSSVPALDVVADHTAMLTTGFRFFDGLDLVPHQLHIGHDRLFELSGAGEITLNVALNRSPTVTTASGAPVASGGYLSLDLIWEYLAEPGWMPFAMVRDLTKGFSLDGSITLSKDCGPPMKAATVNGIKSFWIRARVDQALPQPGGSKMTGELPILDTVRARVKLLYEKLPLDVALFNDQPVDVTKDFFPFGPFPQVSATFLCACDEAFQRVGATVGLTFTMSSANAAAPTPTTELTWEYSSPDGWKSLGTIPEQFGSQAAASATGDTRAIVLLRPADWVKTTHAGQSHYWLRVRISNGGYGGPTEYSSRYDATTNSWKVRKTNEPNPPIIARVTASYAYETGSLVADHCVALNHFVYADYTEACRWGRQPFQPFQPLPHSEPTVYLGFDQLLPIGLVSLFADIAAPAEAQPAAPSSPFRWEYRSVGGWSELAVRDETAGFTRSGLIQFIGAPDLTPDPGPGEALFWLRARLKTPTSTPTPLALNGLYVNAVWATQRRSVRLELVGHSDASLRMSFLTQHSPVLGQEQLEVQEWTGTGREWETLFKDVTPGSLRQETDARSNVIGVWIKWEERAHLYSSGPRDRHYTIERSSGLIRFGDGSSGKVPPPGAAIVISYDYGGGSRGNVKAGAIAQLHSAVPYIDSVVNAVAASGGSEAETLDGVRRRGRHTLRARGRALTAEDYEWLAREASSEVALAQCQAATGARGEPQPGWVTVVIAPGSTDAAPSASAELLHRVRTYLEERAPAGSAGRIRVVSPSYLPIAITADVVVAETATAALVEEVLGSSLADFLHPLYGGPTGTGWRFGQAVHLSQVARIIRDTPGVAYAANVQLAADDAVYGDAIVPGAHQLPSSGRHLLKLRGAG